jgi:hypothetical protein
MFFREISHFGEKNSMSQTGRFLSFAVIAFLVGTGGSFAQTVSTDEAVQPDGIMSQSFALTDAQERAIYNAVIGQRVGNSTTRIPTAIGAVVPQGIELGDLPDQAVAGMPGALKYAMVEGDVVVVDPIRMRVVDVIHHSARP